MKPVIVILRELLSLQSALFLPTFGFNFLSSSHFSPFPLLFVPVITWYKDGRPLTSAAGLTLLKRSQVLAIERAQLSDAGTYKCVAVNVAGAAETSVSLQVYGETPPLTVSRLWTARYGQQRLALPLQASEG